MTRFQVGNEVILSDFAKERAKSFGIKQEDMDKALVVKEVDGSIIKVDYNGMELQIHEQLVDAK